MRLRKHAAKSAQPSALYKATERTEKLRSPFGNTETGENKKTLGNGRRTYVQLEGFQKRPGVYLQPPDA
jgi:hypothetical protein